MTIIACPECCKKISSRTPICNYCGFQLGEVSEADLELFRARKLRDRIYRLNMISYAVITVFIAAFGWYWWDSRGFIPAFSQAEIALAPVPSMDMSNSSTTSNMAAGPG
jgi:hypothetical protein